MTRDEYQIRRGRKSVIGFESKLHESSIATDLFSTQEIKPQSSALEQSNPMVKTPKENTKFRQKIVLNKNLSNENYS